MNNGKAKFMAYDWDGGEYVLLPTNNVVDAIHVAWNYEFDVHEVSTEELIFSGRLDNEDNSELLEPYGLRVIDDGKYRALQDIRTEEIYKADWQR